MILGRVSKLGASIEVSVRGAGETSQIVNAIVDTGFDGHLTLPQNMIADLGLTLAGNRRAMLADGSILDLDIFRASVTWHDRSKHVLVMRTRGAILVGMRLLLGSRVSIDVRAGGVVRVERLD